MNRLLLPVSLDDRGTYIREKERVSAKYPRGCVEFYCATPSEEEAWVRHGWDSFPVFNRRYEEATASSMKECRLRIYASPGTNMFRVGVTGYKHNRDYSIVVYDHKITPVRIDQFRVQLGGMIKIDQRVTVEPAKPMSEVKSRN